jgi:TetR/AcrR family transcriptional regulator, cholesterol catabolism regulator
MMRVATSTRRQEILDTATAVFAEKGIVAATVRDISERAGILSGSLYHHFASKEDMIIEILSPVVRSQIDEFDRIVAAHNDPTDVLRLVIAAEIAQSARAPQVSTRSCNNGARFETEWSPSLQTASAPASSELTAIPE